MFDKILVKSVEDLTFLKDLINNAITDNLLNNFLSEFDFSTEINIINQTNLQDISLSNLTKEGKYFALAVPKNIFSYASDLLSEYILGNAAFVFIYDIIDEINIMTSERNKFSEYSQFIDENLTIYLKEVLLSTEISQLKSEISNRFISYIKYSNIINLSGFIVFMLSDCMEKLYEVLYSALFLYI